MFYGKHTYIQQVGLSVIGKTDREIADEIAADIKSEIWPMPDYWPPPLERIPEIREELNKLLDAFEAEAKDLLILWRDGLINAEEWFIRMSGLVRASHLISESLGRGEQDYQPGGALPSTLNQILFLNQYALELDSGSTTGSLSRSTAYVNSGSQVYEAALFRRVVSTMPQYQYERRVRTARDSCLDCISYESRGWQRIGTLPNPGEFCACRTRCRCYKIFSLTLT